MSKDLQDGDKFHVLVERLQQPNGAILVNKILGARLALSGNEVEAILFKGSAGSKGEYFDATGKSLRAAFLRRRSRSAGSPAFSGAVGIRCLESGGGHKGN
jgi:hypothetical protein